MSGVLRDGDHAIDATAGNGHDTAILASAVGARGRVFAFDTQRTALRATQARLTAAGHLGRVTLINACHSTLCAHAPPRTVRAIMFNLGYLPTGDKRITTLHTTTLAALAAAETRLSAGGVISVLAYPGHAAGAKECAAVLDWVTGRAGPVHWAEPLPGDGAEARPRLFTGRARDRD
ncbi:MAG: class I SAM-dependent methyltransferase [Pseudomonadota bacterium]